MPNTNLHIPALVDSKKWSDDRPTIWGDSYNWAWARTPNEVKYLVIHHTVTKHEATAQDIALLHKTRGWAGIGYHFVITKDGVVHYVGDVGTARANVLNKNEQVIGISLVGDFTKHNPSDAQIISAHELCKFFLFNAPPWQNLNGWEDVVGHKELQATACPGTNWKGPSDSVYNRIKNRIPYTPAPKPPEPQPPKPPEPSCDEKMNALKAEYDAKIKDLKTKLDLAEVKNKAQKDTLEAARNEMIRVIELINGGI